MVLGSIVGISAAVILKQKNVKFIPTLSKVNWGEKIKAVLEQVETLEKIDTAAPATFKVEGAVGGIQGSGNIIIVFL
jgi:hypothetical protein